MSRASVIYLLLPFVLVSTSIAAAAQDCSAVTCSSSSARIRFPFQLEGNQSQNCGYPGFRLSCSRFPGNAVVTLAGSGEFYVRNISYVKQQINLYDPLDCLPRRLMRLNLSGSPYSAPYILNFVLLSCPRDVGSFGFGMVDCLSNGTDTVHAVSSTTYASYLISQYSCSVVATLPVPVSWPLAEEEGYLVDLNDNNLQLSWDTPNCRACEKRGGTCGFKNYTTSQEMGCFNLRKGDRGREVVRIVSLSVTLPAVMCVIGIVCRKCCRRNNANNGGNNTSEQTALQPAVVTAGLSEKMIQSFTKLELGQSRRIAGPNDIVCPICLSEYLPKEVLRCIPECNHCFHADCVDPWLRMNQRCPLCRNSPCPNA